MAPERRADPPEGSANDVAVLRRLAGRAVRVRLADGSAWTGVLRTDLLTDRSVSVFLLGRDGEEGVTLYIHQIAEIVPVPISAE
ncbi:MAG: hypothetical protein M3N49_10370 [Candidatus Eremiobacteraeota bacterium]|nr:hypothetical protein [Candidatus Eremiobacteraeota bacterium]